MRAHAYGLVGVLFATIMAGCLGGDTLSDEGGLPSTEDVDELAAAGLQRLLPVTSFEPTIATSSTGAVFMSVFEGRRSLDQETVFRSIDGGATWESVSPTYPGGVAGYPGNSNDPFIYSDPDTDRIFVFEMQGVACNTMAFSDDDGESWTLSPLGCTPTQGIQDHQSLFTSKPRTLQTVDYPNVVHYCVNRIADTSCAFSVDGGMTWGPMRPLVFSGVGLPCALPGGLSAHGTSAPDGTIYLPRGYCGLPTVAISEDDGLTWDTVKISDTEMRGHEVRMAIDEAGHAYAAWIGTDLRVKFAKSLDGGRTWGKAIDITPEGMTMTDFPAIAAGAEGRVAVAFVGAEAPEKDDEGKPMTYGKVPWDTNWTAWIVAGTGLESDAPVWRPAPVNATDDPIGRGVCGGTRCQTANGGGLGDFIDIDIDAEGRPWAAFVDACQDECREATEPRTCELPDVLLGCIPGVHDVALGMVGTLNQGPALRGDLVPLRPLEGGSPAMVSVSAER